MRNRLMRLRAPVAVLAALALVTLSPGTASATEINPGGDLVDQVEQQLSPQESDVAPAEDTPPPAPISLLPAPSSDDDQPRLSAPTSSLPAPSSDNDQPGHET